jgi:hypothetical protein
MYILSTVYTVILKHRIYFYSKLKIALLLIKHFLFRDKKKAMSTPTRYTFRNTPTRNEGQGAYES